MNTPLPSKISSTTTDLLVPETGMHNEFRASLCGTGNDIVYMQSASHDFCIAREVAIELRDWLIKAFPVEETPKSRIGWCGDVGGGSDPMDQGDEEEPSHGK